VFRTHHGPIIRTERKGEASPEQSHQGLEQFNTHQAEGLQIVSQTMELKANSSNNTSYADPTHIGLLPRQFYSAGDTAFDWTKPVDGNSGDE